MTAAKFACFLLLLVPLHMANSHQISPHAITLGSSLSPKTGLTSLLSPSGLFGFGFYPQGHDYAVGIWLSGKPNDTITWTANRDAPPVFSDSTVCFSESGTLVLRTGEGREMPITDNLEHPAVSASMLDTGNFVLYDNTSQVIWQSFDYPTDTILGGQNLSNVNSLFSSKSSEDRSSGRFYLWMQRDGNLVAYPVNSSSSPEDAYWVSWTFYGPASQLCLDTQGTLFIASNGIMFPIVNKSYIANETDHIIYRATLESDGNFRLYRHQFMYGEPSNLTVSLVWSANERECDIKGLCGLNSFCRTSNNSEWEAQCYCFPGFEFIDSNDQFLGCSSSNGGEEGCRVENPTLNYTLHRVDNTRIGGWPYSVRSLPVEECGQFCSVDCYCQVALHSNGTCYKFKPPIMYGTTMDADDSFVLFVKTSMPLQLQDAGHNRTLTLILAASLGTVALLCSLFALFSFYLYRHRVHEYKKANRDSSPGAMEFTLQSFSFAELHEATDMFKEELSRDTYWACFKGILTVSGISKVVAVKRLEITNGEGEREFRREMNLTGHIHHKNVARLLGYCNDGSRKLLVYEHTSNGSLADLLFDSEAPRPSWRERARVALEIARGLLYLHEECELQIVHCNLKPDNILLDNSRTAKISDFGLAKILNLNQADRVTKVRGTRGHVAPELQKSGFLSTKVDLYSFGVVLLEIVCCRRNLEAGVPTTDGVLLPTWVCSCFVSRQLKRLVEDEEVDMNSLERMVKIGLQCVQDDPNLRPPSIKDVILMLEGIMDIPDLPFPLPQSSPSILS